MPKEKKKTRKQHSLRTLSDEELFLPEESDYIRSHSRPRRHLESMEHFRVTFFPPPSCMIHLREGDPVGFRVKEEVFVSSAALLNGPYFWTPKLVEEKRRLGELFPSGRERGLWGARRALGRARFDSQSGALGISFDLS